MNSCYEYNLQYVLCVDVGPDPQPLFIVMSLSPALYFNLFKEQKVTMLFPKFAIGILFQFLRRYRSIDYFDAYMYLQKRVAPFRRVLEISLLKKNAGK